MPDSYITEEEAKAYDLEPWEIDLDDPEYIAEAREMSEQYLNFLRWIGYPV